MLSNKGVNTWRLTQEMFESEEVGTVLNCLGAYKCQHWTFFSATALQQCYKACPQQKARI